MWHCLHQSAVRFHKPPSPAQPVKILKSSIWSPRYAISKSLQWDTIGTKHLLNTHMKWTSMPWLAINRENTQWETWLST